MTFRTALRSLAVAASALAIAATGAVTAHAEPSGAWTLDAPYYGWEVVPDEGVWYSSPRGTHLVPDAAYFRGVHGLFGGGRGSLGYPTGPVRAQTASDGYDNAYQTFERGTIYSSQFGGVGMPASSSITQHYNRNGGGGGAYGYPTSHEVRQAPGWWYQKFTFSTVYASRYGTHGVTGALGVEHLLQGGGGGALGYPTAPRRWDAAGYSYQTFERGNVYCVSSADGDRCSTVRGGFVDVHQRNGGGRGLLGYPMGDEYYDPWTNSWWQAFEHRLVEISPTGVSVMIWP
ncbi:LGFP repeat-containing protein [Litorihabitans aurantiacus]|uniref:LGFP repeat-containing protein n=1 Tax=Litorihabitans aurantiacus TaxID=1930061 RepID=UPI0024E06337|nr:hypothetical protein [Litorihabitans aurantiacus]